jgi:hypothetical protein
MTRYAPLWQQAGTYPAGTDRGLLGALWPASGSTGGVATTVANTMNVSIAPGTAAVALGTAGALTQLCRWDAAEVVTLVAAPPAGSSRIDLVVLQVRDNTLDSGGNNDFIFQAIQGAGGTPGPGAVPAVPNNAYAVAQLTVPGGAANLNGVTVVDLRVAMPTSRVPLGRLGYAQITATSASVSAVTDVAGLAAAVTVAANRRIKVMALANFSKDATPGTIRLYVRESGATVNTSLGYCPANFYQQMMCVALIDQPAAGAHTYTVAISADQGAASVWASVGVTSWILVEDVGPYP